MRVFSMTNNEYLLTKPCWTYKDIMAYCECKKSKAHEIMKICKEKFNGNVIFNKHVVKRNSVLEYLGTSVEQEVNVINALKPKSR